MAFGDWLGSAALGASGIASAWGASQANDANKKMSREQMQFQERMSSSAYQRAVADMKKAGINPMLSVSQGGASSPSGSQSTSQNVASDVPHSAKAALLLKSQLDNVVADTRLKNSNADSVDSTLPIKQVVADSVNSIRGFVSGLLGGDPLKDGHSAKKIGSNLSGAKWNGNVFPDFARDYVNSHSTSKMFR